VLGDANGDDVNTTLDTATTDDGAMLGVTTLLTSLVGDFTVLGDIIAD
jgi:hypothetical protein